jgi:hypothetical protein
VVFAVDLASSSSGLPLKPRKLFRYDDFEGCTPLRCYDMSANGERFLMRDTSVARREPVTRMDLVVNWTATLPRGR